MEQSKRLRYKLNNYKKALDGFSTSLGINTLEFPNEVIDAIENGRIQKFEYCTELTWKIIKDFLYAIHSIDVKSPRESIKEFYLIGMVLQEDYEILINIIDDRNKLSHIYNEEYFGEIHDKLQNYYEVMRKVFDIINKSMPL